MKFKVQSDLNIGGEVFKILAMTVILGIVGTIISAIAIMINYFLGIIFASCWGIFSFSIIVLVIIKDILNNLYIGSSKEKTENEKLLENILEEIKAYNKSNNIIVKKTNDDIKSSFEDERKERFEK